VVSPILNPDLIEMCKDCNVAMMPGVMTPTEAFTAWQAGADVVKIFPASVGGPRFFKDMRGPLPQLKLMPTGGVNLETASEFIKAGAYAVGVGGALVAKSLIAARDFDAIALNAQKFVKVVADAR
jgi:2-dehydro-3-deoxyphosphogluconate aldolase/(4S)-4-hydroxy-2-oxoglutarate aldolase